MSAFSSFLLSSARVYNEKPPPEPSYPSIWPSKGELYNDDVLAEDLPGYGESCGGLAFDLGLTSFAIIDLVILG